MRIRMRARATGRPSARGRARPLLARSPACGHEPDPHRPVGRARPNVLLVVVDDLRWDDLGAAGHPFSRTPHIDRLAREGARFLNAFAVTPLCSPSRANILTGQYTAPPRDPGQHRPQREEPRAAHVRAATQAAGYETGFIGKWHMGNDPTRAARLRLLGEHEGPGRGHRPRAARERPDGTRQGLRHRHPDRPRPRLRRAASGSGPSS